MEKLLHYHSIPSTQTLAKRLASSGVQPGTIVMADTQTHGRGRLGRHWSSPEGGLYASLILPLTPLLSLNAGVAVAESLIELGITARLKWPNDVLVHGKKIAGILIETRNDYGIVGVGVNISTAPFPGSTCIAEHISVPVSGEKLLGRIVQNLPDDVGERALDRYRSLSATIGKTVRVQTNDGDMVGVATGIDCTGRLLVREADTIHTIAAGDCIHTQAKFTSKSMPSS
jgi:BirA family biotin operon repressor/biotin-[acetyl-CoA-carboxylase] ligase